MTHTPEEELAALRECLRELADEWSYTRQDSVYCYRDLSKLLATPGEDLVSWVRVGGGS